MESGWLTSGPRAERLEREFREYVRAPYALALNSCTAGLHLALAALHIGPGAEVITTPMTFCATVNVILHAHALKLKNAVTTAKAYPYATVECARSAAETLKSHDLVILKGHGFVSTGKTAAEAFERIA